MGHRNPVPQKASFGDLLGRHTWRCGGLLPDWACLRGDAGEAHPAPLSNGAGFPISGEIVTRAGLFSAGLEQVSPAQRSQRNGSRKKPWKVPP